MTVAREKKEAWRQVSVFCLGILTNGWINIKCKSLSLCMDCSPELSPHVYAYFASWMPWTLSIESHTLNSIHLQWDLLYVARHSFRRRVLQVMLPTLCPSTPFPCGYSLVQFWGTLVSFLKAKCSREHAIWWACLKTPPRLTVPEKNNMSGYRLGRGMRDDKLFPQQCMAEELHGLSCSPAPRATEVQKPEQASRVPDSGLKQWH